MANVRVKTVVGMKLTGVGETHGRSRIGSRDVEAVIDEPIAAGGTNLGLTPTETLMSALIGCTNVIAKRIAHKLGVEMGEMKIDLTAQFDRRGTMLSDEVEVPFNDIVMNISAATNATPEQMETIKADLRKYCPIAKVLRGSGATVTENWTVTPL